MTNFPYEDRTRPGVELRIARSPVDPTQVREVMNRLILSCGDSTVVQLFLTCIGLQESGEGAASIDAGDVQRLRNAVRSELGFGSELKLSPNQAWIISVHGDGVVYPERAAQQHAAPDDPASAASPLQQGRG
ncbi:MAG: hypothetical protein ACRERU_14920 [Methylococcales bacterium]